LDRGMALIGPAATLTGRGGFPYDAARLREGLPQRRSGTIPMSVTGLTRRDAPGSIPEFAQAAKVLLACPDARPPAYQAAVGLARAGRLEGFLTGYYFRDGPLASMGRRLAPAQFARWERALRRRHEAEIPGDRVLSAWSFDLALRAEAGLGPGRP